MREGWFRRKKQSDRERERERGLGLHRVNVAQKEEIHRERVGSAQSECGSEGRKREREGWVCTE